MKMDKYIPKHKKGSKKPQKTFVKQREGLVRKIVPKAISRVRTAGGARSARRTA